MKFSCVPNFILIDLVEVGTAVKQMLKQLITVAASGWFKRRANKCSKAKSIGMETIEYQVIYSDSNK